MDFIPHIERSTAISYPCVACGSLVDFEEIYCADCLKAIRNGAPRPDRYAERILAELERLDPDALPERTWLRRQIERAA